MYCIEILNREAKTTVKSIHYCWLVFWNEEKNKKKNIDEFD